MSELLEVRFFFESGKSELGYIPINAISAIIGKSIILNTTSPRLTHPNHGTVKSTELIKQI